MSRRAILALGFAALLVFLSPTVFGSTPPIQEADEKESDPLVLQKLEWFQDMKFGLMMHWGPYSQWGVVESWSICSEDEPWCARNIPDYVEYKRRYQELPKTFNPVKFDPADWARAAKLAGMRYLVFTTKHHDGFSHVRYEADRLPDHRTGSSFRRASQGQRRPRRSSTRSGPQGFGIGAYFSKPDWHSPDYWAPEWATPDRHVNYDTSRYPERWARFKDFTFRQIEELMTGYGKVDILWLDGGWVRPYPVLPPSLRNMIKQPANQDIDMPKIAAMARRHQPGLIVVDRAVPGRYENYRTPEQEVPEKPLPYLWETCMTMGRSWSYVPDDVYKSTNSLIHLLVDIVSKGGNFLLNIGPSPEGELPAESLARLAEIGAWMKVNAEAIYETRPIAPYKEAGICFTAKKDGTVYALVLAGENELTMPSKIMLSSFAPGPGGRIELLGKSGALRWEAVGKGALVAIPAAAQKTPPTRHAWVLKITKPAAGRS